MKEALHEPVIATVLSTTPKVSGAVTAGAAVIWGMTADEWTIIAMIGGLAFTGLTFLVNWAYKHLTLRELRRNGPKR